MTQVSSLQMSPIVVLFIFGVACRAATIPQPESELKPTDLFEIDVDPAEDGTIRGLRIRRSGDDSPTGYLDIEKENDGSFSVNGIRIKRGELSDVDLDEEATDDEAAADRTRRSGDLLGFLGSKLHQKLSLFASSSSGHNAESDLHYGAPVTVSVLGGKCPRRRAPSNLGNVSVLQPQVLRHLGFQEGHPQHPAASRQGHQGWSHRSRRTNHQG